MIIIHTCHFRKLIYNCFQPCPKSTDCKASKLNVSHTNHLSNLLSWWPQITWPLLARKHSPQQNPLIPKITSLEMPRLQPQLLGSAAGMPSWKPTPWEARNPSCPRTHPISCIPLGLRDILPTTAPDQTFSIRILSSFKIKLLLLLFFSCGIERETQTIGKK